MFLTFISGFIFGLLTLLSAILLAFFIFSAPIDGLNCQDSSKIEKVHLSEDPIILFRAGWVKLRRHIGDSLDDNASSYVDRVLNGYKSLNHPKVQEAYFAVLKQTTLYLYETEEQLNCLFCLELTSYLVSIYPELIESELFSKRAVICLTLQPSATGSNLDSSLQSNPPDLSTSLPWYLSTKVNSDKEDWYLSLVQASKLRTPFTLALDSSVYDPEDMAHLIVEGIDRQSDALSMRWLNAILGRIFFSLYKTETLKHIITSKIIKKLKKVSLPSMLSEVQVKEVNIGNTIPIFSSPVLKTLTPEGEISGEINLSYNGEFRIVIETVATINLGSRFKPYSVNLVLAIVLRSLSSSLRFVIKKTPSSRIWISFVSMPKIDLQVEPVVSTRQIKWSIITSAIEARIREVVSLTLVSISVLH